MGGGGGGVGLRFTVRIAAVDHIQPGRDVEVAWCHGLRARQRGRTVAATASSSPLMGATCGVSGTSPVVTMMTGTGTGTGTMNTGGAVQVATVGEGGAVARWGGGGESFSVAINEPGSRNAGVVWRLAANAAQRVARIVGVGEDMTEGVIKFEMWERVRKSGAVVVLKAASSKLIGKASLDLSEFVDATNAPKFIDFKLKNVSPAVLCPRLLVYITCERQPLNAQLVGPPMTVIAQQQQPLTVPPPLATIPTVTPASALPSGSNNQPSVSTVTPTQQPQSQSPSVMYPSCGTGSASSSTSELSSSICSAPVTSISTTTSPEQISTFLPSPVTSATNTE
ncbi:hypothetical protein Pelo_4003 [Pelomyxa schiedti]|nr:hypothetical protein Pelo_4003 [Pelomyxa schiedti]